MMVYYIIVFVLSSLSPSTTLEIKKISVQEMTGVWGQSVGLPCDVSHPPDDGIHLLLWFRDSLTTPIYRFDGRRQVGGEDSHWADEKVLGTRASIDVSSTPSIFRLSSLTLSDEGLYKCRVDFMFHPTKTTRVRLYVVVPPKKVTVFMEAQDGTQKPIKGVVGPLQEGEMLHLICIANGGSPPPLVVWFENTRLIDSHMESDDGDHHNASLNTGSITETISSETSFELSGNPYNSLTLGPLTRKDLKLLLTCEASNNNLTLPTSVVVMVDMLLPPLSVIIRGIKMPWIAGHVYAVECEVRGSRPQPTISWLNGDHRILEATEKMSLDGNVTTSRIVIEPRASQDGSLLRCIAENQETDTLMEDVWSLVVHYAPTAVSTFGCEQDASDIKEGEDVCFECAVVANPSASHVSWRHNNDVLVHNVTSGIIISSKSLVLKNVTRSQAGSYSCHAHNVIGDGASNTLRLDIKYTPICTPGHTTTYHVSRLENAQIECSVQANPEESTFHWMFSNSADTTNIPKGRFSSAGSKSLLIYTPMVALDYGSLLCWATNEVGRQEEPCAFRIVPAEKPDPLTNCNVIERTRTSVQIDCQAGNSRGLRQSFHLQAREEHSKHTINVTASRPSFLVNGLSSGTTYNLMLTAINEKGLSIPHHMAITTLRPNGSAVLTQDGPFEAEVREEAKPKEGGTVAVEGDEGGGGGGGRGGKEKEEIGGGFTGSSTDVNNYDSSSSLEGRSYSHLIPAALGLGAGLVFIVFILLFLIVFRTCHPHRTRQTVPSSTAISISDQTRSVLNSPVVSAKHSTTCSEREIQIDSDNEVDPDIIPLKETYGVPVCAVTPESHLISSDQVKYSKIPSIMTCKGISKYSPLPMSPSVLSRVIDHSQPSVSTFYPSYRDEETFVKESLPQQESLGSLPSITLHAPVSTPDPTPAIKHVGYSEAGKEITPPFEYQSDCDAKQGLPKQTVEEEDGSSAPLLAKRESSV
ncbi:neural cell adhesion molecule 2-like [Palaemon carinicauda]|uniref:neural cell adhesion molecule 2-like n=1 Tax=Palaemon carinicauda TaxID=392227 RepID=UPI0035B61205